MATLGLALLAGILSTLSPCVLPLLPLILGAAVNVTSVQQVAPFLSKTKPNFLIGSLQQDQVMQLAEFTQDERPFVPMVLFVDKNNYIRYQYNGDSDFFKDPARNITWVPPEGGSGPNYSGM